MSGIRGVLGAVGLLVATVVVAGTVGAGGGAAPVTASAVAAPPAPPQPVRAVPVPAVGASGVDPSGPASVTVYDGRITALTLTGDDRRRVPGSLSPDGRSWTTTAPLGYARTYTWSGSATGDDGRPLALRGTFRTSVPEQLRAARFSIADGTTVGVAAPVVLQFDGPVRDRAAVQRALTIRMSQPNEGAWAWLPDTADGSRIHFRPKTYWRSGTVVDVRADLFGVDMGGGTFGAADLTNHLVVGRNQVTKADAKARRIVVYRDGKPIMTAPASFGMGDDLNLVTRAGTHVVTNKDPEKYLSNPAYGYANIYVRWAVRINNNGEFVHFNPLTLDAIGQQNLTHGCININERNAKAFYDATLIGDPVEVTGSPVTLSAADGDLYDWTIPWARWTAMSAAR
ncbi:lipoprotein-anchoring transpeptidase ErfK/SrfK [Pseudonocardia sediminis]|uniref:Lipoprotein-anchoring transpeptidase ErfK/SrfK n=1 Tax=Pseudonocardia sediminis TaxID=1397368 RepID=A0A4Q7V4N4_PSEST|nr:Ig-like domain-containing protein [Pseudonocardia sediminis]RZT88985.1 lipoprotein-anchoring transpeptidase ErfK/SrfK [Pseudonocardia sediminis]